METVILVVAHTNRGAMGVILNRPKPQRRQPLWQRRKRRPPPRKPVLYFGGPVTGPLMAIHTDPSHSEMRLMPGVFFSGKKENVLAALRKKKQLCKLFLGYVGWGPRQLEYEVQIGVWRVVPGTIGEVFSRSNDLWHELHTQASRIQFQTMFHIDYVPVDPTLN